MQTLREWLHRLWGTVGRARRDADLEEELRSHLALAAEDAEHRGARPPEARRAARIRAGAVPQTVEALREQRGLPWVDDFMRDVRYAVRVLGRSPAFTAVALVTLALGIGANTAVYQLLDAVRLRSLPVRDPHQLAIVELADRTRWKGRRISGYPVLTNPLWEQLRDGQDLFAGVLAWSNAEFRLQDDSGSRSARGLFVSGGFFDVLGVRPSLGRVFTAADDRPGCGLPGAVVSYGFWLRQLGGDPAAIGRTIALDAQRVEVIGVTPPEFWGLEVGRAYDVAVPICAQAALGRERGWLEDGTIWWLTVMGRLRADRPLDVVNVQLAAASPGLFEATAPAGYQSDDLDDYVSLKLRAVPGGAGVSALRGRYGNPLVILLAASGLVLLIACTNLANLILARASARERELAVRLAVGASRGRLVRQLMVEHALLAVTGAAAGLALAHILSRFLLGLLGVDLSLSLPLDVRAIAFIVGIALLTCVAFGLIPAWRASRTAGRNAVKATASTVAGSRGSVLLRQALVVSQVALSLVLLVGALLFTGTLRNLLAVDTGFDARDVVLARVDFSRLAPSSASRATIMRDLLDRLRRVPQVSAAAEVRHVPMGGTGSSLDVRPEGGDPARKTTVRLNAMSEGYLKTMGIVLKAGRDFGVRDGLTSPKVAIVNERFAQLLGLGANPVGRRFRAADAAPADQSIFEIVGLVPDTKYFSLREEALPIVFVPMAQITDPRPFTDITIRSVAPLAQISSAVERAASGVSPLIGIELRTFDSTIQRGLSRERLMAALSAVFGALAAVIAAVGLYGVVAYLVARRTQEIGIRLALGARPGEILLMVLREAGTLVVCGLAVGAGLALVLGRSARSLLFGLEPSDLGPVALACMLLAAVGAAASLLPARRAAHVDPTTALRVD